MSGYDWYYYFKKAYALYPGILRPVSAEPLEAHYQRRRKTRGPLRTVLDAGTGLAFHLWIPWRARRVQKRFGLDAAWRQTAIDIAHATFADPQDIALFRIEHTAQLHSYIRRYEDAALNKLINPTGWQRDCALADKSRFAARCRAANLPHPATIAVLRPEGADIIEEPAGRVLIAKPADGEGGSGVRTLGSIADAATLRAQLPLPTRGALLVQPRLNTHPALRDLSLAALPTVRIVTMLDEAGRPEVVSATFRCPTDPAAIVDNMKAGGLISAVALDSGRLGPACLGYGGGDHTHHPGTAAPIADRMLPDWSSARSLVARAHAMAFSDYVLIGWDVALTPEGPVLLEGNGKPGVLMPQRAARAGLAQGRYGILLAHHLAAATHARRQTRPPPR